MYADPVNGSGFIDTVTNHSSDYCTGGWNFETSVREDTYISEVRAKKNIPSPNSLLTYKMSKYPIYLLDNSLDRSILVLCPMF